MFKHHVTIYVVLTYSIENVCTPRRGHVAYTLSGIYALYHQLITELGDLIFFS